MIARCPPCVVSCACFALECDRDPYPTGWAVLSGCFENKTHSPRTLRASVSSVYLHLAFNNASIGSDINFSWSLCIAHSSSAFKLPKCFGWVFFNFLLRRAAIRAKLGTKRRKSLHSRRKEQCLIVFVGDFSFLRAAVVFVGLSRRRGRTTWPG